MGGWGGGGGGLGGGWHYAAPAYRFSISELQVRYASFEHKDKDHAA